LPHKGQHAGQRAWVASLFQEMHVVEAMHSATNLWDRRQEEKVACRDWHSNLLEISR